MVDKKNLFGDPVFQTVLLRIIFLVTVTQMNCFPRAIKPDFHLTTYVLLVLHLIGLTISNAIKQIL